MTPIGIDTSVLIGLLDERDIWHSQAVSLRQAILRRELEPVYFDCVLTEGMSTIARRLWEKGREDEVEDLLDRLAADYPIGTITWILPDVPRLYEEVVSLVRSSAGELNFNDALIALACQERSIPAVASFDGDFDQISWLKRLATPEDAEQFSQSTQNT